MKAKDGGREGGRERVKDKDGERGMEGEKG